MLYDVARWWLTADVLAMPGLLMLLLMACLFRSSEVKPEPVYQEPGKNCDCIYGQTDFCEVCGSWVADCECWR